MKFQDPPRRPYQSRPRVTAEVLRKLKERPGEWALLGVNYASEPTKWKKRLPGLETTVQNVDQKTGLGDVYVRWIGERDLL